MNTPGRRRVLRAIAGTVGIATLGGCVTGGRLRRYRISNDPPPEGLPAAVSASAVRTPTRNWPLIVEITFESTGGDPTIFAIESPGSFPFGHSTEESRSPPPTAPEGGSGTPFRGTTRIGLAGANAGVLVDGCWTMTDVSGGQDDTSLSIRLEPGESISAERAVLNDPENPSCYPIGEYRFTESYRVQSTTGSGGGSAVSWGFNLEISDLQPEG